MIRGSQFHILTALSENSDAEYVKLVWGSCVNSRLTEPLTGLWREGLLRAMAVGDSS